MNLKPNERRDILRILRELRIDNRLKRIENRIEKIEITYVMIIKIIKRIEDFQGTRIRE